MNTWGLIHTFSTGALKSDGITNKNMAPGAEQAQISNASRLMTIKTLHLRHQHMVVLLTNKLEST